MDEEKEPIEQLQLIEIADEIIRDYMPAESIVDCDELLTIGNLRLRMGAVPMFGSQQSDPLVIILRHLAPYGIIMRNVPGSGPALLLKRKVHYPTPAEEVLTAFGSENFK